MRTPRPGPRRRSLLGVVAAFLVLTAGPTGAQEDGGAPPDGGNPTSVPDDQGVVHSWALVPGDGSLTAGERTRLTYELPPGGAVDDYVTIYNYSNVPLVFDVYATDAFNTEDGGFSLLPSDQEPEDVGTWVELPAENVYVPAGTQAAFPIRIEVPADARPGDHIGAVLAGSMAVGTGADGDTVTVDRRTGTRLYVRVDGPLNPELAVEDLTTTYGPSLNPLAGEAEVTYTIVNRGNVRLGAEHHVSVSGPFGLFEQRVPTETLDELLPGESHTVTHTLDGVAATGLLSTKVHLTPVALDGDDDLGDADRTGLDLAIPFTVVAVLVIAMLMLYARRAYRRRGEPPSSHGGDAGPSPAPADDRVLVHQ